MQMATSGACRHPSDAHTHTAINTHTVRTRVTVGGSSVASHPDSAGNYLWSRDAMRASYHS